MDLYPDLSINRSHNKEHKNRVVLAHLMFSTGHTCIAHYLYENRQKHIGKVPTDLENIPSIPNRPSAKIQYLGPVRYAII